MGVLFLKILQLWSECITGVESLTELVVQPAVNLIDQTVEGGFDENMEMSMEKTSEIIVAIMSEVERALKKCAASGFGAGDTAFTAFALSQARTEKEQAYREKERERQEEEFAAMVLMVREAVTTDQQEMEEKMQAIQEELKKLKECTASTLKILEDGNSGEGEGVANIKSCSASPIPNSKMGKAEEKTTFGVQKQLFCEKDVLPTLTALRAAHPSLSALRQVTRTGIRELQLAGVRLRQKIRMEGLTQRNIDRVKRVHDEWDCVLFDPGDGGYPCVNIYWQ